MQSRQTVMYLRLFQAIAQFIPDYNPNRVITDFEIGVLTAIRETFPGIDHSGCLFHFGQCLYRKLQKLPHLHRAYLDNFDGIRTKIRCFQALAFVPENMVFSYFCVAAQQLPQHIDTTGCILIVYKNFQPIF